MMYLTFSKIICIIARIPARIAQHFINDCHGQHQDIGHSRAYPDIAGLEVSENIGFETGHARLCPAVTDVS